MPERITMDEAGSDSANIFNCLHWIKQIEYIIEAEYDDENALKVSELKRQYFHLNKRLYNHDLNRYNHFYLKGANINQCINLYDSLNESAQYDLIAAILADHPHLIEMVEIHENLTNQPCSGGDIIYTADLIQ